MNIIYQKHSKRTERAKVFWSQVVRHYMPKEEGGDGLSAEEIAEMYINPKTGKHYTRTHIFWILGQAKLGNIQPKLLDNNETSK